MSERDPSAPSPCDHCGSGELYGPGGQPQRISHRPDRPTRPATAEWAPLAQIAPDARRIRAAQDAPEAWIDHEDFGAGDGVRAIPPALAARILELLDDLADRNGVDAAHASVLARDLRAAMGAKPLVDVSPIVTGAVKS